MSQNSKIAIVGIGGVFPGAKDLEQFWQNIITATDAAIDVGEDRWRLQPDELYSSGLAPDRVNSRRACLVENFQFEPAGLHVDASLLQRLDPMYQILLHAGRDAWNDANTTSLDLHRVGIVIGNIVLPTESSSQYSDDIFKHLFEKQLFDSNMADNLNTEALNRYVAGLPGGLLASALGLGGGAYTLDAACASSLYSLKYAIDELRAGRRDAMLAGGVSRPDSLYTQMGFSQLNAISKTGRCSPFDSKADGLVVGEGAGIFVLKRLEDALKQGDHIYATIAGIGLSNDIEGNIMSPDSEGQLRAMLSAYEQAGWQPNAVQHVECHGTGTPKGDGVEFNSLQTLWQKYEVSGDCVIGSVKSNVGHLLTAAGAAALMKTLLAMKHATLPPTANFASASDKLDLDNSHFRVLQQAEPWESGSTARRAAISGFGFGGINAHVLLEQYSAQNHSSDVVTSSQTQNSDIAIVGMDSRLGPWHDQSAFATACLQGPDQKPTTPSNWWGDDTGSHRGYQIDDISIQLGRYRIPPAELKEMLPQQLLMLEVAANALADAGLTEMTSEQQVRSGVYIGIALDMNTTNFHFRWMQHNYARDWLKRLGLQLTDAELVAWINDLRTACGPALSANRTMGALGGIVASRIARAFRIGGPSFTVSAEETSGIRALESGIRALQQGELDQVVVGAVDLASELRAVNSQSELADLDCVADGATAFILKRHEDAVRDGDRIYALVSGIGAASHDGNRDRKIQNDVCIDAMQDACTDANTHLDNIDQVFSAANTDVAPVPALQKVTSNTFPLGHSGAANGLFAVAQAVASLYHRVQPAVNNVRQASHWLKDRADGPKRCLVNAASIDGNCMSVLLEQAHVASPQLAQHGKLFFFSAADKASLLQQVNNTSFTATTDTNNDAACKAAVFAKDAAEFDLACRKLIDAINKDSSIDDGQCFYTTSPLYAEGKIAFVYPGSGNHFYGMGQDLGLAFPQVLEQLNLENEHLASQFAQGRFWQPDDGKALSHEEVIFGQVWLGTFISDVVSSFDIKPDAVIGYSLGETAGFFSTRTWKARDDMLERISNSKLFTEELAGPCTSVQRAWGTSEPVDWALGVINASAASVREALADYSRVYLLIVNTPNECVIGGDREQLQQAVNKLNAQYHPLTGVTTVHCEVAEPVKQAYRDLHIFPTQPPADVTFYSGIRGGAYKVTQDTAADSILDQALAPFDYTSVINSAYDDGVRLFIEMGPGGSCTRMIDQILIDRPHYAKAICIKGQDSVINLCQVLARLYVEGVPVQGPAYNDGDTQSAENAITVATGGQPFNVPPPPQHEPAIVPLTVSPVSETAATTEVEQAVPVPMAANSGLQPLINQMQQTEQARARAQETFLRVSQGMNDTLAQALSMQMQILGNQSGEIGADMLQPVAIQETREQIACAFDRDQCMEFAVGHIGNMLGTQFSDIDQFPTRVRLPDEPLMLVDRIIEIEGEADSLPTKQDASGRVVTEHDVKPGAWYLDQGRIPTCIAVESGQADLFLSGYLGIDHITKGVATYRLLDAQITFHGPLPQAGETIRYDIHIDHFFRQGDTWLFRFNFEGTVNGQPLLTMTNGCAGFFTRYELDAGQGIVLTSMEKQPAEGRLTGGYKPLVPLQVESFSDDQMNALRSGDLAGCFGSEFSRLPLNTPAGLPGGRMTLVHRILKMDPAAGRYGLGQITGEADIHPEDWFLTCHFVDDRVMPGTLMYECCLHTLRVYLLRMGWVGESDQFVYEPIIGEVSTLKCRGQVIETTSAVQYEITLKEIGYRQDGTPYVLADALMYADHRPVVQMKNMSVQLTGLNKQALESLWRDTGSADSKQVLFDNESILAFAVGKPSEAFGERYKVFDRERKIARLPGPPYKFLDRITSIKHCEQWQLKAGGEILAEYDVPPDEWYFDEDNQPYMPFAVLLEVALQPCGWLAAYLGSALTSENDLSFRNLGGKATQFIDVTPNIGTLTTRVKLTNVSQSGGMIIQNFDYEMQCADGLVYKGDTYFGFFSKQALADQVGIREVSPYQPTAAERQRAQSFSYPVEEPLPGDMMRMVHEISLFIPDGGPHGKGFIEGKANVNEDAWFFKAHFYEDPVWPGSLGLESFLQLLKVVAKQRWQQQLNRHDYTFESIALNQRHEWIYRGQILPTDGQVTVQAVIRDLDDNNMTVTADGFLTVDGRIIYQMKDFVLRIRES